ncbi:MAG: rhodanese-like domain-containing protein [Acidobacteriota bacterium]
MPVKQISPLEAKKLLDSADGTVYIDVRSTVEFEQGHVPDALNIPLLDLDPSSNQMVPNPDFLSVVEAVLPKDRRIICGCAAGGRSNRAAEIMTQAGYQDIQNMAGGFSGARDPMGRLVAEGWCDLNLPVSTDSNETTSYASLAQRRSKN